MNKNLFQRIIDHEIPAKIVYEDDVCLAFEDIHPQAPVHVLVIPKKEIASLDELTEADAGLAGHLLVVCKQLAAQMGRDHGYRVVNNCGPDSGQAVPHLHFHLLGGRAMSWPPG